MSLLVWCQRIFFKHRRSVAEMNVRINARITKFTSYLRHVTDGMRSPSNVLLMCQRVFQVLQQRACAVLYGDECDEFLGILLPSYGSALCYLRDCISALASRH